MRKSLIVLFSLLPLSSNALTKTELKALVENSIPVKQSIESYKSNILKEKADRRNFYPTLSFSWTSSIFYPYYSPTGDKEWQDSHTATLTATMNLWNFQNYTKLKIDKVNTKSAKINIAKQKEEIYLQALIYLIDLKAKTEKIERKKIQVKNAEKILKVAEEKYKEGLTTITDVLKAKANLQKAKASLTLAINEKTKTENALISLLNLNDKPTPEIELKKAFSLPTLEKLENIALQRRPEIKIQEKKIENAQLSVELVKDTKKPSVTVSASYSRSDYDLELKNENYQIALNINWQFFDSGKTKYEALSAGKTVTIEKLELENLKNKIKQEVADSFADYQTNLENLKNAESYLKFAKESYKKTLREYQLGVADIISLLTSQDELSNAEENYIDTIANLNISYYKLLKSSGLLMEE